MTTGGGQSRDAVVTIRYPVAAGRDGEHLPSHDVGNDAETAAGARTGFQIVVSVSTSLGVWEPGGRLPAVVRGHHRSAAPLRRVVMGECHT